MPGGLSGVTATAVGYYHPTALDPILPTGPSNAAANTGGSASFGMTPRGTGPFTYQWGFDGFTILRATSATLNLTNLQASYSVVARDSTVTVVSASAKLVVNSAQDPFAQPRVIPGGGGRLLGSTLGATREPGEPLHAGNVGGAGCWRGVPAALTVSLLLNGNRAVAGTGWSSHKRAGML